jgi:DNA-binding response OmpR family regulator
MTPLPGSVVGARPEPSTGPGFALYVGVDESAGLDGRIQLAELAQAIGRLVEERLPAATTHSALALGAGQQRAVVDELATTLAAPRPGSATARAEAVWGTPSAGVVVDTQAREVTVCGRTITLTFKEFALLEYLLRAPKRAVPREELLCTVWRRGVPSAGTRTIDVHVRRLREKLGGCLQIVTVRGVGYRCDPTPDVVLVGSGDAG